MLGNSELVQAVLAAAKQFGADKKLGNIASIFLKQLVKTEANEQFILQNKPLVLDSYNYVKEKNEHWSSVLDIAMGKMEQKRKEAKIKQEQEALEAKNKVCSPTWLCGTKLIFFKERIVQEKKADAELQKAIEAQKAQDRLKAQQALEGEPNFSFSLGSDLVCRGKKIRPRKAGS